MILIRALLHIFVIFSISAFSTPIFAAKESSTKAVDPVAVDPVALDPREPELCARTIEEIESLPDLKFILDGFGGAQGLEGQFKLAGIAGSFANIKIAFWVEQNRFFVLPRENDSVKVVFLCYTQAQPTVLRFRVQNPSKPENGLFLVKPAPNSDLRVAAAGSNWNFMRFKRLDVSPKNSTLDAEHSEF